MFPHRLHRGASHLPARRSRQNATFIYYQALSGRASLPGGRKETYVLKNTQGFRKCNDPISPGATCPGQRRTAGE
jgi:hypothetical protein